MLHCSAGEFGVPFYLRRRFFEEVKDLPLDKLVEIRCSEPNDFHNLMDSVIFKKELFEYIDNTNYEKSQKILDYFTEEIDSIITKELRSLRESKGLSFYKKKINKLINGAKYKYVIQLLASRI